MRLIDRELHTMRTKMRIVHEDYGMKIFTGESQVMDQQGRQIAMGHWVKVAAFVIHNDLL